MAFIFMPEKNITLNTDQISKVKWAVNEESQALIATVHLNGQRASNGQPASTLFYGESANKLWSALHGDETPPESNTLDTLDALVSVKPSPA